MKREIDVFYIVLTGLTWCVGCYPGLRCAATWAMICRPFGPRKKFDGMICSRPERPAYHSPGRSAAEAWVEVALNTESCKDGING